MAGARGATGAQVFLSHWKVLILGDPGAASREASMAIEEENHFV